MPLRLLLLACAIACVAPAARAHPYHISVTEARRNAETNRVEVAMRLWPEDLESALERRFETKVSLERTERIDALITAYLADTFWIAPAGDEPDDKWHPAKRDPEAPPRVRWVGKEITPKEAWLYFEVELPSGANAIEGLWLSNRVLWEATHEQENVVSFRDGDFRASVRCDRARPWARIASEPDPKSP